MRTLVIIPCLNEQGSISKVFSSLIQLKETSVCLVDDGSSDKTFQEFNSIKRSSDYALRFPINLGVSAAISAGANLAINLEFDVVLQCDGDGQHTGESVEKVIDYARQLRIHGVNDFVLIGSRFTGEVSSHGTSRIRIFGSRILRVLLRILYRARFTDPTSGLRIYSGRGLRLLKFDYPQEWPESIVLGRIIKSNIEVHEIAVGMAARDSGESKIRGIGSAIYMLKVITLILTDRFIWKPKEN
jgi:glycosyltransferase involved in cell wall biosynthesis